MAGVIVEQKCVLQSPAFCFFGFVFVFKFYRGIWQFYMTYRCQHRIIAGREFCANFYIIFGFKNHDLYCFLFLLSFVPGTILPVMLIVTGSLSF